MKNNVSRLRAIRALTLAAGTALSGLVAQQATAATATVFAEDFESFSGAATSLADEADADPVKPGYSVSDDVPAGFPANTGIQVINWQKHAGSQALLVRSGSTVNMDFFNALSGSRYTLDLWVYDSREATADRGFRLVLVGEGSDYNGSDFLAYRAVNTAGSTSLQYYDGVGPGAGAWVNFPGNVVQPANAWQHHRLVIDPNKMTFDLYLDDMTTPVVTGAELARPEVAAPTRMIIQSEGNSADDGYFIVDDITLTADDAINLNTTFTEGFESYSARTSAEDDADPKGPWITTEIDGTGTGRVRAEPKVQVVDASVVTPHSGSKSLKLEYGQRAGVTLAWGAPTNVDVEITWWARVPAAAAGVDNVILRMSLYGVENGSSYAGDAALLGWGCRSGTVGDSQSLIYYDGTWVDTTVDYALDTWEQYRLTTHNKVGSYTIVKNPSSGTPQVLVSKKPFIGTGPFGPMFMLGFSSSNGTNHPPVYLDDIQVRALNASPDVGQLAYAVKPENQRFTNSTVLTIDGPVGSVAVDPRDNSTVLFTIETGTGGIYKATKVASGNWSVDPTPVVANLSLPSGLTVGNDGTLWWVHDNTMALMRLKAPWASNTPETIIRDFGVLTVTNTVQDDDTFDLCFPPAQFTGSAANSSDLLVMDRGVDANEFNAVFAVNPATTELNQSNYTRYLVPPTKLDLGAGDLVDFAPLPPSEVATICLDGQVTAIDGNGVTRPFWPGFYQDASVAIQPAAIAADPKTGRIWIADDLTNKIFSCSAADGSDYAWEVDFPVTNLEWPELAINFAEPGMTFSPNGNILVVSDSSPLTGKGRVIILHNEPIVSITSFAVTGYTKTAAGFQLNWESAGNVKYRVQRTTDLKVPMVDISGDLTTTTYTDATAPAGGAFYRVVVLP